MTTKRRRADLDDDDVQPTAKTQSQAWEPSCIRCGREMLGYKARFGLCATCIEREFEQQKTLLRAIMDGTVPQINPKYAPDHVTRKHIGPLWNPEELTEKALVAREKIGLQNPTPVEMDGVPF